MYFPLAWVAGPSMSMKNEALELKLTDGDTHSSGEDFDLRAESHFVEIFRTCAEQLCPDVFNKMLGPVEYTLNAAKLDNDNIHARLKAGGLTRVLEKQEFLQDFFNGRQLTNSKRPDEAVAYSVALLASNLAGNRSEKAQDLVLLEVALLIGCGDDRWSNEDAERAKCEKPRQRRRRSSPSVLTTIRVLVQVYEGERAMKSDNNYLEKSHYTRIEASFNTDKNGIPNVTVVDKSSGKQNDITTTKDKGLLSEKALQQTLNGTGK
uniref:DUF5726 domain-containing protein n=1 Tax=Taenia asiatica TaxID=60517 RepID=A0A0R3WAV4_TAEAS